MKNIPYQEVIGSLMYAALGSVAAVQFGLYPDIFKQSGISPSSEKKIHENQLRIG